MKLAATKVSARGQVVIPQDVRAELGLKQGDTLLCGLDEGRIILIPSHDERLRALEDLFAWGRRIAKVKRIRRADVQRATDEIRYGRK